MHVDNRTNNILKFIGCNTKSSRNVEFNCTLYLGNIYIVSILISKILTILTEVLEIYRTIFQVSRGTDASKPLHRSVNL